MDMELLTFIGKEVPNAASDIKESLDLLSSSKSITTKLSSQLILKVILQVVLLVFPIDKSSFQ